jgi:hypothetical protein
MNLICGDYLEVLAAGHFVPGFLTLEEAAGIGMNAGVSREIHFTGCAIRQPRFDTSHMRVYSSLARWAIFEPLRNTGDRQIRKDIPQRLIIAPDNVNRPFAEARHQ